MLHMSNPLTTSTHWDPFPTLVETPKRNDFGTNTLCEDGGAVNKHEVYMSVSLLISQW